MYDLDLLNLPNYSRPGICEGHDDPDIWHSNKRIEQAEAKRICGLCPVRDECLTWALDHNEPEGIWGGLDPKERKRLRRNTQQRKRRATNNRHKRGPAGTCTTCGAPAYSGLASYCDTCIHGTPGGRPYHLNRGENTCDTCLEGDRSRARSKAAA